MKWLVRSVFRFLSGWRGDYKHFKPTRYQTTSSVCAPLCAVHMPVLVVMDVDKLKRKQPRALVASVFGFPTLRLDKTNLSLNPAHRIECVKTIFTH
jgi:hypothetical protein